MVKKKTVMIVGGGGRECALVWAYGKSKQVGTILAVPGNDWMQEMTRKLVRTFPKLKTTDSDEIVKLGKKYSVDLVDIAQDNAVAAGLGDAFEQAKIPFIGPKKMAGRIEWDKNWAREFMRRHKLPHPAFKVFGSEVEAKKYLNSQPNQKWVIKANGLAEGKGVIVAYNTEEAIAAITSMKQFGKAGEEFLIEQFLEGEEFSMFVVCDGKNWQLINAAQDHKLAQDGDVGLNTGGMGCSSPPLLINKKLTMLIANQIIRPVVEHMRLEGNPYTGILYLGGMMVKNKPYIIEFNARWGDPEAQVILPGVLTDIFEIGMAVAQRKVNKIKIRLDKKCRVVVAGTARGYPQDYSAVRGKRIFGLERAKTMPGVQVFGSAIKIINGKHIAHGGRLFYIVGEGQSVLVARARVYAAMAKISIEGNNLHYRTDIGWRDVQRLNKG